MMMPRGPRSYLSRSWIPCPHLFAKISDFAPSCQDRLDAHRFSIPQDRDRAGIGLDNICHFFPLLSPALLPSPPLSFLHEPVPGSAVSKNPPFPDLPLPRGVVRRNLALPPARPDSNFSQSEVSIATAFFYMLGDGVSARQVLLGKSGVFREREPNTRKNTRAPPPRWCFDDIFFSDRASPL